ncbi:Outer membrane protein TolC [Ferrimonas sediminum]|uniref:Outer membrane protein TolC n=1 Tax=Ferrimonas sediminum TaxID=718193 RepID=A0A1G8WVK9_9GAMM|nr:TolC family protein [Ferrimonas sediminum]SDJ82429.1 Outer membrane protein TolC [Ferrimonas sediminum]
MHPTIRAALVAVSVSVAFQGHASELSLFATQALSQLEALPQIRAEAEQVTLTNLSVNTADQALYNPELSLDVENLGSDSSDEDYTLALAQAVDWADKRGYRTRLAQLNALQAQADYQQLRNDALATLLSAWVNLRQARQLDQYAALQQQRTQSMLSLADKMVSVGELAPLDTQLLTLELARVTGSRADARQTLISAESQLTLFGGDPALALPAFQAPLPGTDVNQQLPALKGQYQAVLAAKAGFRLARQEVKADPTFSVGAVTNGDDNSVQLGVSVPLNIRNRYQGEINEANQGVIVAEQQYLASSRALKIDLESLSRRYGAVADSLNRWQQLTQDSLDSSHELLQRLWRGGELPTSQYLQSQQQLSDTWATGATLEAQQTNLWIEMMASRGELESWLTQQAVGR